MLYYTLFVDILCDFTEKVAMKSLKTLAVCEVCVLKMSLKLDKGVLKDDFN